MSYKVYLDYFKKSGKWYESGEYTSDKEHLFEIWDEVIDKSNTGELPNLKGSGSNYFITVDVPDHPYSHPKLIVV